MALEVNLGDLLRAGGVYRDVKGSTVDEVFKTISETVNLPSSILSEELYEGLKKRNSSLTTAVGNGLALPHTTQPILKKFEEQRIFVCYLDQPIDMNAPDSKKVNVMIVLLTCNSQSHLQIISKLAGLLQNSQFKKALEDKADSAALLTLMRKL